MTIDAYPTTSGDRRRAQRKWCVHTPDRESIVADDTDHTIGETVYVSECRRCFAHITTGYINGDTDPENAEWTMTEGR